MGPETPITWKLGWILEKHVIVGEFLDISTQSTSLNKTIDAE